MPDLTHNDDTTADDAPVAEGSVWKGRTKAAGRSGVKLAQWVIAGAAVAVVGAWAVAILGPRDSSPPTPSQSVDGGAHPCPEDLPIKGNVNADGERIAHSPGQRYYSITDPEKCFATIQKAEAAGYRPSHL